MALPLAEYLVKTFDVLRAQRSTIDSARDGISRLLTPNLQTFLSKSTPGDVDEIIKLATTHHIAAAHSVVNLMVSHITDPADRWFEWDVAFRGKYSKASQQYLIDATEYCYYVLSDNSNYFPTTNKNVWENQVFFGLGAMFIDIKDRKTTFQPIDIEQIYLQENERREVDTVIRHFSLNAVQAYKMFGDALDPVIIQELGNPEDLNSTWEFLHAVWPNPDSNRILHSHPYLAAYVDVKNEKLIGKPGGYAQIPYITPRYMMAQYDPYGRSRMWLVIPQILMNNKLAQQIVQGIDFNLNPVRLTTDGLSMPTKFVPGLTIKSSLGPNGPKVVPYGNGANVPLGLEYLEYSNRNIDEMLLLKNFSLPDKEMTAHEVRTREVSIGHHLGPQNALAQTEYLDKLLLRVLYGGLKTGQLREIPEELTVRGGGLRVHYTGRLAKMQKLQSIQNNAMFLDTVKSEMEINPSIGMKVNLANMTDRNAEILGISPEFVHSNEEYDQMLQQQAQAAQQQQQQEALPQEAAMLANLGRE